MIGIAALIAFLVILQDFLLYVGLVFNFKNHHDPHAPFDFPKISVFVPARNEASHLPSCLASLGRLDYEVDKIEFILGNDDSTDDTEIIMQEWILGAANRKYINITPQASLKMNGKANALAQMIREAKGDYFLFTDADCEVPDTWVKEMVGSAVQSGSDLVTGITKVRSDDWFSAMQGLDWWLTLGMVKVVSDTGSSLTSMGNNMLLSRNGYEAIGGFENLPLTVTEDFEIAKAAYKKGLKSVHQVTGENLIITEGEERFHDLMIQRKRWLKGAFGLPLWWKGMLGLQVLFFPAILVFMTFNPGLGLALWLGKVMAQSLFIKDLARPTGTITLPIYLISFELYYLFVSWSTILYYFWPVNVKWKDRSYA